MTFAIVFLGWMLSLTVHEFSHALVAYWGGDYTVKDKGYLTFNPLRYTDPFYSLILPLIFLVMGGIGLPGGAVYIETWRLKNPRWSSLVSIAGPASNFLMLIVLLVVLRFTPNLPFYAKNSPWPGLAFLAFVEVSALVLNLLPVPPFDGYGVIEPFLPENVREGVNRVRAFLPMIVFFALWGIPLVYNAFWFVVTLLSFILGVPINLLDEGYARFRFWTL